MNDERSMILKMLQDGKISVEEADALLDVLKEPDTSAGAGFTPAAPDTTEPADAGKHTDAGKHADAADAGAGVARADTTQDSGHDRHDDSRDGPGNRRARAEHGWERAEGGRERAEGGRERAEGGRNRFGAAGFEDFGVDLSALKDTLRMTMGSVRETVQGVSDSLKEAFSEFGGTDVVQEFARAMGRVRADDERELSADTDAHGALRVTNKWGDVRVTGVDATSIRARARITCWDANEELARAALANTHVRLDRHDGEWEFTADLGSTQGTRIDVEFLVPRAFDVTVSSASGDLWLEDLSGSQTVNTMSGDINIGNLGSVPNNQHSASTKSGDVIAASLIGDVRLNTLSGDVSVNGFSGSLHVSTKSGDIRVIDGRGSVHLQAVSGDIEARLLEPGSSPLRLTSVSGDIRLVVPSDASLAIDAKSLSGDARVELDLEDAVRREHRISGLANGGALVVEISSVSGDVTVKPAD